MKPFSITVIATGIAFSSFGFAGGPGGCNNTSEWTKIVTLSGGTSWARPGNNQTTLLDNGSYATYNVNKSTELMGTGELYFALQWPFTCNLYNQFGISFGGTSEATVNGPLLINNINTGSTYFYRTNHSHVSLKGKMVLNEKDFFIQPFINASVGVAFNQAYGFETLPTINPALAPAWYDTNTAVAFTYSAGAGIQTLINKNWDIGVGYLFSDWGKSGLGTSLTAGYTVDGPHLTHIYSHSVLAHISYRCS